MVKTSTRKYRGHVCDYATSPRLLERESYNIDCNLAITICIEALLKSEHHHSELEFYYRDVHILLSAELKDNEIYVDIYDCYPECQPYFDDLTDYIDFCFMYMSSAESCINGYQPFALSFTLNKVNYAIITQNTGSVVYQIVLPEKYNSTYNVFSNEKYLDCISSGTAGTDTNIDLSSLI